MSNNSFFILLRDIMVLLFFSSRLFLDTYKDTEQEVVTEQEGFCII